MVWLTDGIAQLWAGRAGDRQSGVALVRRITSNRCYCSDSDQYSLGGKTPVSGIMHAVFILLAMVFLAPLASYIPLAALAAILMVVAWNMSEHEKSDIAKKLRLAKDWCWFWLLFWLWLWTWRWLSRSGSCWQRFCLCIKWPSIRILLKRCWWFKWDRIPVEELPVMLFPIVFVGHCFGVGSRLMDVVEQLQPAQKYLFCALGLFRWLMPVVKRPCEPS